MPRLLLSSCVAGSLVLFAGVAAADSECASGQIVSTQPADGQTDVPVDAVFRLQLKYTNQCADDFGGADILIVDLSAGAALEGELTYSGNVIQLNPTDELLPNSEYTVRVFGSEATADFTFKTGERRVTDVLDAPTVEVLELVHDSGLDDDGQTVHLARVRMTPSAADPDNLSLLELFDDTGPQGGNLIAAVGIGPLDPIELMQTSYAPIGGEICYEARHVTGNGTVVPSGFVCVASEDNEERFSELTGDVFSSGGCNAANGSGGGAEGAIGVLGLVFASSKFRRRRAR